MTKHTPGPWKLLQTYSNVSTQTAKRGAARIYADNGERMTDIAHIPADWNVANNAEFIVRACNAHDALLAAGETAADAIDAYSEDMTEANWDYLIDVTYRKLVRAINMAKEDT